MKCPLKVDSITTEQLPASIGAGKTIHKECYLGECDKDECPAYRCEAVRFGLTIAEGCKYIEIFGHCNKIQGRV